MPLSPCLLEESHDLLVVCAPDESLVPELLVYEGKTRCQGEFVFVNELVHSGGREDHVAVTVSLPHF